MATRTTNYDLYKPDATDNFSDFRAEFNDNMDIIDQNLGGGGGSGGHTIIDENGQSMTQRAGLEFTGNVQVTDDSVNDKTIVDILGGGGDVVDVEVNGVSVLDPVTKVAEITSYKEVTEAQYESIPIAERETNGIAYFIKDLNNESVEGYPPLIYSDEEREIGVWRDGKPLYQRTITYETPFDIANGSWYESSAIYPDINIVKSDIVNSVFAHYTGAIVTIENSKLVIGNQTKNQPMNNIKYVTIQYTKTTDVAGSGIWNGQGGIAHHYSTNETVIGTWYNGKPIYEKTYEFPTALLVEYNSWSNTTIDSSNIQTIIDVRAWHSDGTSYGTVMADPTRSSHTLVGLQTTRNNSQANVKVLTIQYTKTTD